MRGETCNSNNDGGRHRRTEGGLAQLQYREVTAARPRDNRSPAVSEGRYRGSDLAVTAGELNAVAGRGGRLVRVAFEGQSGFPVYFEWEFEK